MIFSSVVFSPKRCLAGRERKGRFLDIVIVHLGGSKWSLLWKGSVH